MKRWTALGLLALIGATPPQGQPLPAVRPKLIVAIAVDQFSADLFNEYRPLFTQGLKRMAGGVVFPAGYQGHAATETCPGHSTILTGSRPAHTGIIANDWQDPDLERRDKDGKPTFDVYCAEKPGELLTDASKRVIDPHFLRVPTLGDRLKAAGRPAQVVSVSGKDRAAVMLGGSRADLTLWWNGKGFGTYVGREETVPTAIAGLNLRFKDAIDAPVAAKLPPVCASRSRALKLSPTHSVGTLATRKSGDEAQWRQSPEFDAATLDVALAALKSKGLGRGNGTDLLAISFSATDYIGHGFGTAGAEMCANLIALDATLGRLFAALDASGTDYAVVLTADHGGTDLTERNRLQGLPGAGRVLSSLSASAVGMKVAEALSLPVSALNGRGTFGDMYVARSVPANKRAEARALAIEIYRKSDQVQVVFTREELIAAAEPAGQVESWSLLERAKASFDPERSGDFVVLLKPYVLPAPAALPGFVATHGSPWGYDRRVPILFWWKGIAPFEQPNGVETADILPTLASLIDLDVSTPVIDGRCLDLIAGEPSNCSAP